MITRNIRVFEVTQKGGKEWEILCCDDEGSILWLKANHPHFVCGRFYQVTCCDSKEVEIGAFESSGPFELLPDTKIIDRFYNGAIMQAIGSITSEKLATACSELVLMPEFKLFPSAVKHHSRVERFPGGLIVHTGLLLEYVMMLLKRPEFGSLDKDIVLTAGIWHDSGKMVDYEMSDDVFFRYSQNGVHQKINHVSASAMLWTMKCAKLGVDMTTMWEVAHCILASHGRKEWDSPVEPQTREAQLIHQVDMLSGRVADADLLLSKV